jgi:hypothetical protein
MVEEIAHDGVSAMKVADMAMQPSLHQTHTLIFFVATLVCLAIAVLPPLFVKRNRSWERRVAWSGVSRAAICVFLASLRDWKLGIGLAIFCVAFMTAAAYFYTPYIKIRGKVYAFSVQDSLPATFANGASTPSRDDPDYDPAPDSYGGMATAQKAWWLNIFAMAICSFNVMAYFVDKDNPWLAALLAAAIILAATAFGYGDAIWGYSIARGQRLQFWIIAIITAGVFTIVYLGAYYAGKRWPLRRKQSMEYRAHPRHQKRYP